MPPLQKANITFQISSILTDALRWCYDPNKKLPDMSALRFIHIQQVSNGKCKVTGHATGRVWLQTLCDSQGIIGTEFLLDAEDILERVSKEDVWKKSGMCIEETKKNAVNIYCTQRITDEGTIQAAGNILVRTYGGDIDEFVEPSFRRDQEQEELESEFYWKEQGSIAGGRELAQATRLLTSFSQLKSDTAGRIVYFYPTPGKLYIFVTEKGGDRGQAMLCYQIPSTIHSKPFGIEGRHLSKIAEVFNFKEPNEKITLHVEYANGEDEEPTRVCFVGNKGYINLPAKAQEDCPTLSRGAITFFLDPDDEIKTISTRTFHIDMLYNGICIQTPRKGSQRDDILLEEEGNNLVITKRSDINKQERSEIQLGSIENVSGEWKPIVVPHGYISEILEALNKEFSFSKNKEEDVYMGEEFVAPSQSVDKYITLRQTEYTRRGITINRLHLYRNDRTDYIPLQGNMVCTTIATTMDVEEDD